MNGDLDARLRVLAEAVRPGSIAADVGCDHGYLICELVGSGRCPSGFACDVRPLPLESARLHIRERELEAKIETILCDGLTGLPGNQVDDVVIAGMGGELIGELLAAVAWVRDTDKRFVLQPMTRAAELRRFLYREGFALLSETAVESGGFVYAVMTAAWTGKSRAVDELFAHTGLLLAQESFDARRYLQQVRVRLAQRTDGMERAANKVNTAGLRRVIGAINDKLGEEYRGEGS